MELKKMEAMRTWYLKELAGMGKWIVGSLIVTERRQGGGMRPFRYLSRSIGGRNRITYVSERQMGMFEGQLKNGKRAEWLLVEISELTVGIVKLTSRDGGQKK